MRESPGRDKSVIPGAASPSCSAPISQLSVCPLFSPQLFVVLVPMTNPAPNCFQRSQPAGRMLQRSFEEEQWLKSKPWSSGAGWRKLPDGEKCLLSECSWCAGTVGQGWALRWVLSLPGSQCLYTAGLGTLLLPLCSNPGTESDSGSRLCVVFLPATLGFSASDESPVQFNPEERGGEERERRGQTLGRQ